MRLIHNKKIKSIIEVTLSNILSIISGVLVGLLLPKILSVEDYGLYKTFTLYATYAGFLSLGIIDGIVLRHGGDEYQDLNRSLFRSYFRVYFLVNSFFSLFMILISVFLEDTRFSFIGLMLSLYVIAINISGYFQQLSQITQRFKEYSLRKIIISVLNVVIVGLLFLGRGIGIEPSYRLFLIYFILIQYMLTTWYVYTYRDVVFGESLKLRSVLKDVLCLIKTGFPLLFANICSTLILTLDRQFVSALFDTETYAVYAFAYNMLSLVTVAMSAVSTVLYPTLKRTTPDTMKKNYASLVGILSIIVFAAISIYYPLCVFVEWFLPKYSASLIIFRIVFPGLALSSSITVVMHNYYKTLGKNHIYFIKSIVVLVVSGVANAVAYLIFKSTSAISIASIITMLFWYLYIEQYFVKVYSYNRTKNLLYIVVMMLLFYAVSFIPNYYLAFVVYLVLFFLVTYLLHKDTVRHDLVNMLNKNKT